MFPTTLKTFVHPHSVYKLELPAIWDQVIEKDGESCGFGPHERDDVGLWISILPMSVDTERLQEDLPKLMEQSLAKAEANNLRKDPTLNHYGLIADMAKTGEGGNYWIIAGGDIVLFASSQVPIAERDLWNPPFHKMMASLHITRDNELLARQVANEVLRQLKDKHPDQDFAFDNNNIRGKNQIVYLSNLTREVKAAPARRDKIIKRFVDTLSQPSAVDFGHEVWEEIRNCVVPVLKPRDYVEREGPTRHFFVNEWLSDILICYAIRHKNVFRFVTSWDLGRWNLPGEALHDQALANLTATAWPKQLIGSGAKDGRVIVVMTDDNLASSRLLCPDLHKMFAEPLGSPFWAGIPSRDTLVLFSNRRELKQRIGRRLKKDYNASAYQITPQPLLVTPDGVAVGRSK
ncbi:MAG TPA: hypothetical protein VFE62_01215 [Gemmataceae bacterium]|nr:hypothetical protein [Gemmataceae bacterium]